MRLPRITQTFGFVLALTVLAACSATDGTLASGDDTSNGQPSPSLSDDADLALPTCPAERIWVTFESNDPAVRFRAPVLDPGLAANPKLESRAAHWDGMYFAATGGCRIGEDGYAGETFGGASEDMVEATSRRLVFNYRWYQRDGKSFVIQSGEEDLVYQVDPLEIMAAGTEQAVLFRASSMQPSILESPPSEHEDELVAVINFPPDHSDTFASLTIHLDGLATLEQLRTAVESFEVVSL